MKKLKFIYIAISVVVFVSCESELDIEPQQSVSQNVATTTADNVEAILLGAYDQSRGNVNTQGNNFSGDIANIAVLLGNTDQAGWNGTFANLRDVYFKQMVASNVSALTVYADAYLAIGSLNTVLANLDKFEDDDRRNKVEGEAKFLRALTYFELVRLYGQPYDATGTNTQDGVPVVLDPPNIDRAVSRNSVAEVYAQVVNDLMDAYDKLPSANGTRADKYAAGALLARVYLQQGNYAAARDAADDVIANSGHSLMPTFAEAFDTDDNTNETLFSWIISQQEGTNWQNVHFADEPSGGRQGDINITPAYLAKFDSAGDARRNFTYAGTGTASGLVLSSKFRRQFANTNQIRLAEMHLIRAEGNFREGSSVGMTALDEINALRARSLAPALGALTIDLILNERELELGFEGFVLHDYKRTQRAIGGLPYNDSKLVFPIPQSAIDRNPNLTQNSGY